MITMLYKSLKPRLSLKYLKIFDVRLCKHDRVRISQRFISCLSLALILVSVLSLEAKENDRETQGVEVTPTQTIETTEGNVVVTTTQSTDVHDSLEPFLLTVSIAKPSTLSVSSDLDSGRYGDFLIEKVSEETQASNDSRDLFIQNWRLYPRQIGANLLPPIPYRLNNSQDAQNKIAETVLVPQITFNIEERNEDLGSVDQIVPDLRKVSSFPVFWTLLVLCVLALALFLATRLLKRKVEQDNLNVVRESPLEKVLRRLDELKRSTTYLENAPQFYVTIDGILRDYLGDEFSLNAEKQTAQEILRSIDSYRPLELETVPRFQSDENSENRTSSEGMETNVQKSIQTLELSEQERVSLGFESLKDRQIRSELEQALGSLDYIKFAKKETTFNDASQIYDQVRSTIENASGLFRRLIQDYQARMSVSDANETSTDL